MQYLLLLHYNNGYTHATQCYMHMACLVTAYCIWVLFTLIQNREYWLQVGRSRLSFGDTNTLLTQLTDRMVLGVQYSLEAFVLYPLETFVQCPLEALVKYLLEVLIQYPLEAFVLYPLETFVQCPLEALVKYLLEVLIQHPLEAFVQYALEAFIEYPLEAFVQYPLEGLVQYPSDAFVKYPLQAFVKYPLQAFRHLSKTLRPTRLSKLTQQYSSCQHVPRTLNQHSN